MDMNGEEVEFTLEFDGGQGVTRKEVTVRPYDFLWNMPQMDFWNFLTAVRPMTLVLLVDNFAAVECAVSWMNEVDRWKRFLLFQTWWGSRG